jgi:hypothetical protein
LKPVVEVTVNILTDATAYHSAETLGQPLEMTGNAFITCKLLSAERVNRGDYSLFELLGCHVRTPGIAEMHQNVLKVTRCLDRLEEFYHPTQLPYSYSSINRSVAALRKCQLKTRDVLVVKDHEHEGVSEKT